MTSRSIGVFYFCIYMFFPIPVVALASTNGALEEVATVEQRRVGIGDYIKRQALACFRKADLDFVTNPKTANTYEARLYFKYPYQCSVTEVGTILLRYERKFVTEDGATFWTLGVGTEPDGEVKFYIVLPASTLK